MDTSLSTSATWWKGEWWNLLNFRIRDVALRNGFVSGKVCMSVHSLIALLQNLSCAVANIGLCFRYARRHRDERSYNCLCADSLDSVNSPYCSEFDFVHPHIGSVVYN